MKLSPSQVREQFPQLRERPNGRNWTYLDSAATALKPQPVIDRLTRYYGHEVANIHRGAHFFGDLGTQNFEAAREAVARFIGARSSDEIVFTRGTTESINLVAQIVSQSKLKEGDVILLSQLEHHSNIVPWQLVAAAKGLKIRYAQLKNGTEMDLDDVRKHLRQGVQLMSLSHGSNATGSAHELTPVIREASSREVVTVVDAAQTVVWGMVDVQALGCDFLAFSGHKLFGPTGIGSLFIRSEVKDEYPVYQGGGSMIESVFEDHSTFLKGPHKYEAGTPNIAGAIGLHAAIDFMDQIDHEACLRRERDLVQKTIDGLLDLGGIEIVSSRDSGSIVSFLVNGVHPSDVAQILDQCGVAVRAGHLCCQPLMRERGWPGVVRASFSIYSDETDVQALIQGMTKVKEMMLS